MVDGLGSWCSKGMFGLGSLLIMFIRGVLRKRGILHSEGNEVGA